MSEQYSSDDQDVLLIEQSDMETVSNERSGLVFIEQTDRRKVALRQDVIQTVIAPEERNIFVNQSAIEHVFSSSGDQGPQGIPGRDGLAIGSSTPYTAAITLSGQRVVRTNSSGEVLYADNNDLAGAYSIAGITIQAAAAGATVSVQSAGRLDFSGWGWTPDAAIFLGSNGNITQTRPTTGFFLSIGYAETPTRIFIRIGIPIFLN